MLFPAYALEAAQVRFKSVSNEGHFTLEDDTLFVLISPRIPLGSLTDTP
jgi:hypothetical protein